MTCSLKSPLGVAALRPWPFGPPLRGRASRSDAKRPSAHQTTGTSQATAPVGGLPCVHPSRCML